MYYATFTAPDGKRYYLVNGWNKHKTFFTTSLNNDKNNFKSKGSLKMSITKLLKVSDLYGLDYSLDTIEMYYIDEFNRFSLGDYYAN